MAELNKYEVKREIESFAKRHPKKGIDPTIPSGIREQLVDEERKKMFQKGEGYHSKRTLASGGKVKGYADGGGADGGEMTEKLPSVEGESGTFKEAFAAARRQGKKQFTWNGKSYNSQLASDKKAPAVSGRPRGESVGQPARKAPRFAADRDTDRNVVAAAIRNREAAAEQARESRRSTTPAEAPPQKVKRLSTAGLDLDTLLPIQGYRKGGEVKKYAKGGVTRADGCASKGRTKGTMR